MIDRDIRGRAQKLAQIGLFPRFFGHDVSSVFKQKYHGNVTIVPEMSMTQSIGLHAIINPSLQAMDRYIMGGKKAVRPHIQYITHLVRLEAKIHNCLSALSREAGDRMSPEMRSYREHSIDL